MLKKQATAATGEEKSTYMEVDRLLKQLLGSKSRITQEFSKEEKPEKLPTKKLVKKEEPPKVVAKKVEEDKKEEPKIEVKANVTEDEWG